MSSYWLQNIQKQNFKPLEKNIKTQVCIIGGGLTGLTTAYYLKKQNIKAIVLEREEIISKTSGHTTGKITSQHGLFYDYLIHSQGEEKARQYLYANEEAIQNIETIIKNEKIDCEFEHKNSYVFTNKETEVEKIKQEVEALKKLEYPAKYVTKTELPFPILAAIEFSNQAQFHAGKYAMGLLKSIQEGVSIYEHSKVVDLQKHDKNYDVILENGMKVNCEHVVVATRYPIFNTPGFHFLKMYQATSYLMAFETCLPSLEGMYINSKTPTLSLRNGKTKNILMVGGQDHKTGEDLDLRKTYEQIEKFVKQWDNKAKMITKWEAEDCISLDKIPYIGEYSNLWPNVYVATGFKKWGITSSNVAANIIVDKILGKQNQYEEVFKATRLEPIKNHKEMENMVKEAVTSIGLKKLKVIDKTPTCTHLGCSLTWNNLSQTWDCPCHGSRFEKDGKLIEAPSLKDLKNS